MYLKSHEKINTIPSVFLREARDDRLKYNKQYLTIVNENQTKKYN